MLDAIIVGGRVALLGLPAKPALVDWNKVIFKQLTIKGIYGRAMFETWRKMIAMLESELKRNKVITHRLSASRFLEGFEIMRSGRAARSCWIGGVSTERNSLSSTKSDQTELLRSGQKFLPLRSGAGKCVPVDAPVNTADGALISVLPKLPGVRSTR